MHPSVKYICLIVILFIVILELILNDNTTKVKPRDVSCKELLSDLNSSIKSLRKINIWRKTILCVLVSLLLVVIVNDVVSSLYQYNSFEYLVILFLLFYFVSYKMLAHIFHHVAREIENNSLFITYKFQTKCVPTTNMT